MQRCDVRPVSYGLRFQLDVYSVEAGPGRPLLCEGRPGESVVRALVLAVDVAELERNVHTYGRRTARRLGRTVGVVVRPADTGRYRREFIDLCSTMEYFSPEPLPEQAAS